ncbi:hypothetical protein V8F20_001327 [Naviculisporaceae sp. PSN 640]
MGASPFNMAAFESVPEANTMAKPSFEIVLDSPSYFPGDVITGTVKRRAGFAGFVSPRAIVNLKVFGGTIIHVAPDTRRGHEGSYRIDRMLAALAFTASDIYRSSIKIFEAEFVLHDGPIHIPQGQDHEETSWQFTIPLPLNPVPVRVSPEQQEASFLPLTHGQVATQTLPFSFNDHLRYDPNCPAGIEYGLVAEMFEERHGRHYDKSPTMVASTFFNVRPPPAPPILDSQLKSFECRRMVSTHRLLSPPPSPSSSGSPSHLPPRPKQSFFKKLLSSSSSKEPYYLFNLQANYPTTIQLDSINPIPFLLRIVSARQQDVNAPPSLFENMAENPGHHPFYLTSLKLKIKTFTEIAIPRQTDHPVYEETTCEVSLRWDPDASTNGYDSSGLTAPIIPDSSKRPVLSPSGRQEYEDPATLLPMLDIGALIDWRVGSKEVKYLGRTCKIDSTDAKRLYPDFVTYNIRHRHVLRWEVGMSMAKETFKVSHEDVVEIVPSCSWS